MSFSNVLDTGKTSGVLQSVNNESDFLNPAMHHRAYETRGVRFVPAEIIFYNAFRGQIYSTHITIINISSRIVHLAINQPYSSAFHIEDPGVTTLVAPGLCISRKVIFKCAEGKLFDSVIPIRIEKTLVLLPIKVIPGQTRLVVEPTSVDFGRIDLGSPFVMKTVQLHNKGSITAKFSIDLSNNELDIMITPRAGNVGPFGTAEIKVQLAGLVVGSHMTEFWVKSTPPSRFTVKVEVVIPYLQAIHPFATDEFTLLDMMPCFPGTQSYETFVVRNASSDTSSVVVLAECEGLVTTPKNAALLDPSFQYFKVEPSDGSLAPFESRIFAARFSPQTPVINTGWKIKHKDERSFQYLSFFRIQRVTLSSASETTSALQFGDDNQCVIQKRPDFSEEDRYTHSTKMNCFENEESKNIIRVCTYSVLVLPRVKFVPDELIFENAKINEKINKVLHLTNICDLPLGVEYVKQAHISVTPSRVDSLEPKKSIEVLVQLFPRSHSFENVRLAFNLLSYRNMTDKTDLIPVGRASIKLTVHLKSITKKLVPKFLPGITPRVHPEGEEVGIHTEIVTFNSVPDVEIPRAVVWPKPKPGTSKPWLDSNARVAFPNERRRSLRVTAHDINARSIFTGLPRYNVPNDPTNVYSRAELAMKRKNEGHYKEVVSFHAARKINLYKSLSDDANAPSEYSVDNEKLFNLLGIMRPAPPVDYVMKSERPIINEVLCPLTPLQLFNVKVHPQVLDFGKMPCKTDCSSKVAVENMNPFPIDVRFKTYKTSLKVPSDSFIVPAQSTVLQEITLNLETIGKHYTNVSYTINTYHSYDIKVTAEVEVRSLIIEPEELTFRESSDIIVMNCLPVKLINPLAASISFNWKIPNDSSFTVIPNTGLIKARNTMTCCAFFSMKSGNQLGTVLTLLIDGGSATHFPVNFMPSNQLSIMLFSPKISCPNISLGIDTVKKIIVYNFGRQVAFFSVDERELPNNVKILPFTGIIKPRSCYTLNVIFHSTEIRKFSFTVPIMSVGRKHLLLTCNGFINYPLVKFRPRSILFRKTSIHSFRTASFTVTNENQTEIKIKFVFETHAQFRISTSEDYLDDASMLISDVNLKLPPLETRKLFLHFEPHDLAGYSFLLPVVLNDIIGPPILNKPCENMPIDSRSVKEMTGIVVPDKLESIKVEVAVQRGYIKCSSNEFQFFKTDLKEKAGHTLIIENIYTAGPITLRLEPPFDEVFSVYYKTTSAFAIQPFILAENESLELSVSFHPSVSGSYDGGVPIYVEEYSTQHPYTILKVTGVFYRSTLLCSTSLINFVPVSVSVEIDRIINIIANHQPEDTKLIMKVIGLNGEPLNDVFQVSYPNSNVIPYGIDNFVIPVRIKFSSDISASVIGLFTATDGFDGECKLVVTAVADRSTLTTHPFQFMSSLCLERPNDLSTDQSRSQDDTISSTESQPKPQPQERKFELEQPQMTGEILKEIEQYPLFPENSSDTLYARHMRRTKESIEDWVYEQGFQGVFRMTIGKDYFLSEPYQNVLHSTYKNVHFEDVKGILNLISLLTGREFSAQYPLPPNIPQDNEGRVEYAVLAYASVINFLTRQGGHLTHVSPIYLLCHGDYLIYHQKLKPLHLGETSNFYEISQLDVVIPKATFTRLSTQCWLDVFLQLYKVLVFFPIILDPSWKSSAISALYSSDFSEKSNKSKLSKRVNLRDRLSSTTIDPGKCEELLLVWLTDVFNFNRPACVTPRTVTNFCADLEDGVVLAVVTSHFCPFMHDKYWAFFYLNPRSKAECQNNFALLCLAWKKIKIGLSLRSQDLTDLHPLKMLFLCTLLFQVLPTYLYAGNLTFEACLADSVCKEILLTNPSDRTIGFSVAKIDPNNSFSIVKSKQRKIVILPKKSFKLSINFYARSVNSVPGTLLLRGTCYPGGYATNLVFSLKGSPAKLQHTCAYNVICPLYKVAKVKINLTSPFSTEGEFDLCLAESEPKPGVAGKLKPWGLMKNRKVIRNIYLSEASMIIPPSMDVPVPYSISVTTLHLKTKEYWIVFFNQKIGDFVVKINIIPDTKAPHHILRVPIPSEACTTLVGTCTHPVCPRRMNLSIPSRNIKLWAAAKTMLTQTLRNAEKPFWDEYLQTGLGMKLISWISRQYYPNLTDTNFLYQSKVTYNIECDPALIECPSSFTIEDVHSENTVQFPIHVGASAKPATVVDIKMKSEDEKELRFYQIIFFSEKKVTKDTNLKTDKAHSFETPDPQSLQVWCVPPKEIMAHQQQALIPYENTDDP